MITCLLLLLGHLIRSFAALTPKNEPVIDYSFMNELENPKFGLGGSAPHYVAYHPKLNKKYFIKTHRFNEEAEITLEKKALEILRDVKYIPKHLGFIFHERRFRLVLEHVRSFNLGKLHMSEFRRLIYPHALFYISQILQALENVNSAGLLYVDVKAENILIDSNGLVVFADFGGCGTPEEVASHNYSRFCTPYYASYEVLVDYKENSIRSCASEWWSFGVLCYIFFNGVYPFNADSVEDLIEEIKMNRPNFLSLTPQETILVSSLIEQDIEKRLGYHSGLDRLKALSYFDGVDWTKVKLRELVAPIQFENSNYTH
jgi:serine/threonine protein kinase